MIFCVICSPPNQDYKVKHLKQKDQSEENFNFELESRVKLETECEVKKFVTALHHTTGYTLNIMGGKPNRRQRGENFIASYNSISISKHISVKEKFS